MYQYTSGPSYQIVHGSNGGHKKSQKSKTYKKQALEIYKARKLYNYKSTAAADEISKFLKTKNIKISIATIETKWVPEFKNNTKSLK